MDRYGPHSYGEGFADVYDEWYGDLGGVEACVSHVAELAAAAATDRRPVVLELGIGTGRLALPLAAAGLDVRGIDASPAMVEVLRAKPGGAELPVVVGDFRDVAVPASGAGRAADDGTAEVVLCACNTLFNLTEEDDQRRCLAGVAAVLRPGGALVVEAFVPPPAEELDGDGSEVRVRSLAVDRVVLTAAVRDAAAQTMAGQYVDITETGIRLRPWALRYLYPEQLDALAGEAGLVLEHRHAGWAHEPFGPAAERHVSRYRRPVGR